VVKLAAFYGLPAAYLNKQLQALARAGIVASTSGPRGGFRLARGPASITLLDVVVAIEGWDEAFRCEQLLKQGPGADPRIDYRQVCLVSQAMRRADLAWRRELAGQTLADLRAEVEARYPATPDNTVNRFAAQRA
jgi:Rrf2 family protein